jgi:hypothetical protein
MNAAQLIIGLFLIAHGLVHAGLAAAPRPDIPDAKPFSFWTSPSWLLKGLGESFSRPAGTVLWIASLLLFVAAGLGVLGVPGLRDIWSGLTVAGASCSLLLLLLFWHSWLVIGVVINIGLLLAVIVFGWTP